MVRARSPCEWSRGSPRKLDSNSWSTKAIEAQVGGTASPLFLEKFHFLFRKPQASHEICKNGSQGLCSLVVQWTLGFLQTESPRPRSSEPQSVARASGFGSGICCFLAGSEWEPQPPPWGNGWTAIHPCLPMPRTGPASQPRCAPSLGNSRTTHHAGELLLL